MMKTLFRSLLAASAGAALWAGQVFAAGELLTVQEVRALSTAAAEKHPAVLLRGVITFTRHADFTDFTMQDATGGLWLPAVRLPTDCGVGAEVELSGRVEPASLAPVVRVNAVRRLGDGILPAPRVSTSEELLATQCDAIRVEVVGVVRGQRVDPEFGLGWLALDVASGSGRVTVNVTHEMTGQPDLVDARVRVRGVCLHSADAQQQSFLPVLNAHSLADVDIVERGSQPPFALPAMPLNEVLRRPGPAGSGHRVHLRGTVTLERPNGSIFVQDEHRGMQVFLREGATPSAGEVVDIVGFPEAGAFSPVVRDADWRPTGQTTLPAPPLSANAVSALAQDGRLLKLRGELAAVVPGERETLLSLQDGAQGFIVHVPGSDVAKWRIGSVLSVTGVCSVEVGSWESFVTHREPQAFTLFARGQADVVLVRPPRWGTPTQIAWVFFAVGAGLLGVLGYVWTRGRRRLREEARTRASAQAQFGAVLAERTRLAREIHDTLAQGFAGISVQLEVLNDRLGAKVPGDTLRHLDLARELVRSSLEEARSTVWNLRAQALEEDGGLPAALERLGRQLTDGGSGSHGEFTFTVHGEPRTLPSEVENNLLRIGQEALTNAVRHAGAQRLNLALGFDADAVSLVVEDDGRGFDPGHSQPRRDGGFGLPGIRERAEEMHADVSIDSTPGSGTHIEILVPAV